MKPALLFLVVALTPALTHAHAPPLEQLPDVVAAQAEPAPQEAAPAPAAPSGESIVEKFESPSGVMSIVGTVVTIVAGLVWLSTRRKKIIALFAYYAFHIVEDVGNEIEGEDGFDKTARYLKELDALLVKAGWRPLKPGEVELAKLHAQAIHGEQVAKTKVAVAAAEAQAEAAKSP